MPACHGCQVNILCLGSLSRRSSVRLADNNSPLAGPSAMRTSTATGRTADRNGITEDSLVSSHPCLAMRHWLVWLLFALDARADDCNLLSELYQATHGQEWSPRCNWGPNISLGIDCCGWLPSTPPLIHSALCRYGITCRNDSQVAEIDVTSTGCNLAGTLPPSLSSLSHLEFIRIGAPPLGANMRGRISGTIPSEWTQANHLQYAV